MPFSHGRLSQRVISGLCPRKYWYWSAVVSTQQMAKDRNPEGEVGNQGTKVCQNVCVGKTTPSWPRQCGQLTLSSLREMLFSPS